MRIMLAAALLALFVTGCGDGAPATEGDLGATDACDAVETVPIQGEGHLVGDQEPPVPYNSTPPTSGWHSSSDVAFTVFGPDQALTEPEQVTVLELGGVLVSYNGLAEQEVAALADLVSTQHTGKAALTPYGKLGDGEVAMTAWGKLQRCESPDPAAISAFVEAYAAVAG